MSATTSPSLSARALRVLGLQSAAASWRHPLVRVALPALDVADAGTRLFRGLSGLPRYSLRVRSTGPMGEFGGRRFVESGRQTARDVREQTGLKPDEDVLEIGCGVGRVALALRDYLEPGRYTGMDVDREAIAGCLTSRALKDFQFVVADVWNSVYNPGGRIPPAEYRFPFPDSSFDVIYCASVFTHMVPEDVAHYGGEVARMLRPGGRLMCSAFLVGHRNLATFPVDRGSYRLRQAEHPEKAIAYELGFLDSLLGEAGLVRPGEPRVGGGEAPASALGGPPPASQDAEQDLLVYRPAS